MKKQIQIIGIEHKKGNKKSDNTPYDFYVLHGAYEDPCTEGLATVSVTIPDQEVPGIEINSAAYLFTHFYKGKEYFDAILPC